VGDAPSVSASGRYVITEQGRLDLLQVPTCHCDPKLEGLLFMCQECGTVYGSLRNSGPFNSLHTGKRD
jgi:hypothetical protein